MEGRHDDLVGREQELAFIDEFLAELRSAPGALLIEGPAGAGKTTVWRAGVERAGALGHRMLVCRPARAEVHLLYGGLSDMLVEHVAEVLPRLPKPQRRAIEIVLLLEGDGTPADQRALAAGVLGILHALATERPRCWPLTTPSGSTRPRCSSSNTSCVACETSTWESLRRGAMSRSKPLRSATATGNSISSGRSCLVRRGACRSDR